MFDKMKQLMEMKKQADQIKRDLDATSVECTDVRGIKIVVNGSQEFKTIEIDEEYLSSSNKQRIESDILRSVNTAIKKSQAEAAKKMKALMPGGMPGF